MAFELLSGIGSVLGGLGGLFGKKKKDPTPRQNLLSQAQGAREAADKYGFNPLTMLQYGQVGGAMGGGGGGAPPLASIDLITGGLKDINDVISGDAARRRAADQLELDLAKVKIDQAKSQMALDHAQLMRMSAAPLGRRAVTAPGVAGATASRRFGMSENPVAPGRKRDVMDLPNSPGVFEIENRITGNRPVTIPGDSEPWGIDELATAVIVGAPQVAGNFMNKVLYDGKSIWERFEDYRARQEKDTGKPRKVRKVYDGPGGPVYR